MAKLWGKSPSEYAGYEPGSLEAYLLDLAIGLRMTAEDNKAAAAQAHDEKFASKFGKMRTDFDGGDIT